MGLWREAFRGSQGPTSRDSPFQAYRPQPGWTRSHAAHTLKGIKQGYDASLNFCRGFWARSPLRQRVPFERLAGLGLDLGEDFQRLQGRCLEEVGGGSAASPLGRGAPSSSVLGGWTAQTRSRRLDATTWGGMEFQSFGIGLGPPGRRHQDGIRHRVMGGGTRVKDQNWRRSGWGDGGGRKPAWEVLNDHTLCRSSGQATERPRATAAMRGASHSAGTSCTRTPSRPAVGGSSLGKCGHSTKAEVDPEGLPRAEV